MGEVEEKIGADYLRLLAARQRLSVLESEVKKMTGNLSMAISLLNGEEAGHYTTATSAPTMSTIAPIATFRTDN